MFVHLSKILSFILLFSLSLKVAFVEAISRPITKPIINFCVGNAHACAVFDTYKMKCWGFALAVGKVVNYGNTQYSIGDIIPYFDPGDSLYIKHVTCQDLGICLLLNNNKIKCVGSNTQGEAGIGSTEGYIGEKSGHVGDNLPFVNLGNEVNVTSIIGGLHHYCALTIEGKVKCYGDNFFGQLGLGDRISRGSSSYLMGDNLPFVNFGAGVEVSSIHSSPIAYHSCVILSAPANVTQRIKCWGSNNYYQLGYGDQNQRGDNIDDMGDKLPLVDLGTESRVKQVAVGYWSTCFLLISDGLKCIDFEMKGQVGTGSPLPETSIGDMLPFVVIDSGETVKLITAGESRICVVYEDMITMKCYGFNPNGELGQGDTIERGYTPDTMIPNITAINFGTRSFKITSIHAAAASTCVIFEDHNIKCFGWNGYGHFAIGSTEAIGNQPNEVDSNETFAILFSPTQAPVTPTKSPTKLPTSIPTRQCDYQSAKLCQYDYKCMWKKIDGMKQCIVFDCTAFNKGKCGKQRKRCKWNKQTSLCLPKTK